MYVNTPSGRRTKSSAPNLPRALTHSRVAQVLTTRATLKPKTDFCAKKGEWHEKKIDCFDFNIDAGWYAYKEVRNMTDLVCMWIAELVPLSATLFSFIYGLNKFFKKGKPLFLQSITMAMGSHALGSIYHICQTLTTETVLEGFTPAYLGPSMSDDTLG